MERFQPNTPGKAVTDRSTAETVTIIGAGIGGIYLVANWA